jgi:hypothetical protein
MSRNVGEVILLEAAQYSRKAQISGTNAGGITV